MNPEGQQPRRPGHHTYASELWASDKDSGQ